MEGSGSIPDPARSELSDLSVVMACAAIADGSLCPVEYVDALLDRIDEDDAKINAFITVDAERARERARQLRDRRPKSAELPPLFGIPYGVKDNIDVLGLPTTCQSRVMPLLPAMNTAGVVQQLNDAGAICLGKLSMDEFALGAVSAQSPWPPARNPLNLAYTPGSSSGGSAAAVAAGFVPFALGTDTGGSIRSPAMMSGIVGFKPTNGSVSMSGVFALAPSLDTVGPLARTIEDASAIMDVLAPSTENSSSTTEVHRLRIGYIRHFLEADLDASPEITSSLNDVVRRLRGSGIEVEDVQLPSLHEFSDVGWSILLFEAHKVHRLELGRSPDDYGRETFDLLNRGSRISVGTYQRALRQARSLHAAVDDALERFHVLLCPVSAVPACRTDDLQALAELDAGSTRIPFNVTGHPALATPIGRASSGLPIACQWITRHAAHPSRAASGGMFRQIAELIEPE